MVRSAQVPTQDMFVTFADRRASVLQALECAEENEGSAATSLPGLTELCKGFRRGELVIFTGPTGALHSKFTSHVYLCVHFVHVLVCLRCAY
jgi:twinkle protein